MLSQQTASDPNCSDQIMTNFEIRMNGVILVADVVAGAIFGENGTNLDQRLVVHSIKIVTENIVLKFYPLTVLNLVKEK